MALSSFFNWQTPPSFNSDQLLFEDPLVYSDSSFAINDCFVDPCCDLSSFSSPTEDFTALLPCFSPPSSDPFLNLPPPMSSPPEEDHFDSFYPSQKRQKCFHDCCHYSDYTPTYLDGFAPTAWPMPEFGVEMLPPLPEFDPPKLHFSESSLQDTEERVVSAQSIAARERRRKITDKTQELGRLIPGGSKMNTADMLQAAFKYVKFMQAQLGILQIMEPSEKSYELHALLSSPCVEEKLYMEEKCLASLEFTGKFADEELYAEEQWFATPKLAGKITDEELYAEQWLATPELAGKITADHDAELKPAIYQDLPHLSTSDP